MGVPDALHHLLASESFADKQQDGMAPIADAGQDGLLHCAIIIS